MVPLNKCCCCKLKTGVFVSAALDWIFNTTYIFGLVKMSAEHKQSSYISIYYNESEMLITDYSTPRFIFVMQIFSSLLSLTFCIILVIGVFKKRHYFFLPWMIYTFILYVIVSLTIIILFIICVCVIEPGHAISLGYIICVFLLLFAMSAGSWLMWVVVYSYYLQVKEEHSVV